MVAEQHVLVGKLRAAEPPDDVADCPPYAALLVDQMHPHRAVAEVVGERQRPLPAFGDHRAAQALQNFSGVRRRERHHGNPRQDVGFFLRQPPRPGRGRPARRQRVAGHQEVVDVGAALQVPAGAPGTLGPGVPLEVAVLHRVGEDQQARHAVPLGHVALPAAIALEVAHQCDLAFQLHSQLQQPLEIFPAAIVRVDHGSFNVGAGCVGVPGHSGQKVIAHVRVRVEGRDRLGVGQPDRFRRHDLHADLLRIGEQHLVLSELRLQPVFTEAVVDVLRHPEVPHRAGDVRLVGQELQVFSTPGGLNPGLQFFLDCTLPLPRRRTEARWNGFKGIVGPGSYRCHHGQDKKKKKTGQETFHEIHRLRDSESSHCSRASAGLESIARGEGSAARPARP